MAATSAVRYLSSWASASAASAASLWTFALVSSSGSSLPSSMPEITSGFLGSLFSVMFLGLSSRCLLFVLLLVLFDVFFSVLEGPSIC